MANHTAQANAGPCRAPTFICVAALLLGPHAMAAFAQEVLMAPGQALGSLPDVTSQTQGENTRWTLPLTRGNLHWQTNLETSRLLR